MVDEQPQKAERQIELEQVFQRNYAALIDSALADRSLFVADAERIVDGLAEHLPQYTGPIKDEAFREWAADAIRPAVSRIAAFTRLKTETERFVLRAIWKVVNTATDLMDDFTVADISDRVWLWAFEHFDELVTPGEAKPSTRLYLIAYWQARAWKTARLRERNKFMQLEHTRDGKPGQLVCPEELTQA